jgi:hypothetical protein
MTDFRLRDEDCVLLQGLVVDNHGSVVIIGNSTVYILSSSGRLWEVLLPEDGLFAPKCIAHHPKKGLLVTQCDETERSEVSVFKYNPDDFRCLHTPTPCHNGSFHF